MPKLLLSDSGNLMAQDPAMAEYAQSYAFPTLAEARYGFLRMESPRKEQRVKLFGQAWMPPQAIGTIALIHGYSEHSGNYARLVRDFVNNQFAVIAIDLRGHGLSEGASGHVDGPDTYAEDSEALLAEIFGQLMPSRPLFLWAHSMGGMVGMQLLLRNKLPAAPKAAVFTSPLLGFPELTGVQKMLSKISPFLAKIAPSLPVSHGIPEDYLTHDREYLDRRAKDPLIKHSTTPRWFESTKLSVSRLHSQAEKLNALSPTLLMLAGEEKVTNLAEARRFAFKAYGGQRHKVVEFPGMRHELEKEEAIRPRVLAESLAWFRKHC